MFDCLSNPPTGAVVALKDTVTVTDPWGFGLTFEVLRSDHERLRAFDDANPETAFGAIHTRGALLQMVGGAANVDAIDSMAAKLEQRGVGMLQQDLDKGKKKLALVAIQSWAGVTIGGVEQAFDPILALRLLGFRGVAWREKGSTQWTVKTAGEWERIKNTLPGKEVQKTIDGKTSKLVDQALHFEGEHRNEAGEALVIPRTREADGKTVPNVHGGNVFGHALALLLLEESVKASATMAKAREEDTAAFAPSPDTALGSGGSTGQSASDSESEPSEGGSAVPPAA